MAALASGALSGIVPPAMPTSSDEDDKNKDEAEDRDDVDEAAGEDKDGGGDDEGSEGGEEEEAAAAAEPAKSETVKGASSKAASAKARTPDAPVARGVKAAPKVDASKAPPAAGLGKSVLLFVVVVGGLSLLMLALGAERGGSAAAPPKWNEGQSVDVDITLVSTDKTDLACASGTEVKGLHCGFESQGKRWTKGDAADDKKILRPYSTTNNINMLAAGVWSEPALAGDKMPGARFTFKCKFNVVGKMPRADVRWHEGEGWNNVTEWYTGSVSDCKIGSVQN
jgi:hypothetical protein